MSTKVVAKFGAYTGNGKDFAEGGLIIDCGFEPFYVCCWFDKPVDEHVVKTECITGSTTQRALMHRKNQNVHKDNRMRMYNSGGIKGFQVSDEASDKNPNTDGKRYLFVALGEVPDSGDGVPAHDHQDEILKAKSLEQNNFDLELICNKSMGRLKISAGDDTFIDISSGLGIKFNNTRTEDFCIPLAAGSGTRNGKIYLGADDKLYVYNGTV
ncbi:MAG: hypothetical protein HWN67_16185 [Candidatus Helarchaeota archaeon]|nr:hypothetical protein [Candidatus Helarchaeota archaeon]